MSLKQVISPLVTTIRHITAHRGQGQTWKNRLVSVNLGLKSPNNNVPTDIGLVIYVSCTRTNDLKNLFLSPIFPTVWENTGKSEQDTTRRDSEEKLKLNAREFAEAHGWFVEFEQEQSFGPDYSGNAAEWQEIISVSSPSTCSNINTSPDSADVQFGNSDHQAASIPGWLSPCESERHIVHQARYSANGCGYRAV